MPRTSAKKGPAPKSSKQVVAISVKLEVNTPDQLKRIVFGLVKGTNNAIVTWTVAFEYHERKKKEDPLVKIVALDIKIDKKAELVEQAAAKGFTKPQAEFAAGPAASAAKRLAEGKTTQEKASRVITQTFEQ